MFNLLGVAEKQERGRVEDRTKTRRRVRVEGTEGLALGREPKSLSTH